MNVAKNEIYLSKNLGIQILRMLLCLWVVFDHCLSKQTKYSLKDVFKIPLHVPSFILISFFFSFKTISGRNYIKINKRFERLLIPYTLFPIMILLINNLSLILFKFSIYKRIINLHDLFIQIIIGRKFVVVFWFQCYLILTTLLFIIISFFAKENYLLIIELIYILSYFLKYSNLNFIFFLRFNPIIRLSIGQFAEVMPMSASGSMIASLNLFKIINKYYKKVIFFSLTALFFIFKYNIFSDIKGFAFGGLILDIGSILLFIIFYSLPLNNIRNPIFHRIFYQVTNYTQGIYSLHLILRRALYYKINSIKDGTFEGCIILYIFCYIISFIGEKIFIHLIQR